MISTDRNIFDKESAVAQRMVEYGALVEELHIIVFSKKTQDFLETSLSENVHIYPTNSPTKLHYVFDSIRIGNALTKNKKLKTKNCLITAQDPFETGFVGKHLAKKYGIAFEVQVHTDFFSPFFVKKGSWLNRIRVWIARRVLPSATGVRVVSTQIKDRIRDIFPNYPADRITVLPVFVDVETVAHKTHDTDLHKEFPEYDRIILMVSRLEQEKNISLGIDVFRHVLKKHPSAGLIIVGDGSMREKLERRASRGHLKGHVTFLGWRDDLAALYQNADLYLHTSWYEGYGRTLVEAAIHRTPIVSTRVGIAGDLLQGDNQQFCCDPGNRTCLVEAVTRLLKNEQVHHVEGLTVGSMIPHITYSSKTEYLQNLKKTWEETLHAKPE